MSSLKCFLYIAWSDAAYRVGISHDPMLDLKFLQQKGYRQMQILSQAIPIGLADFLLGQVANERQRLGQPYINQALANHRPLVKQAVKMWLKYEWRHPIEEVVESIYKKLRKLGDKLQVDILSRREEIAGAEVADCSLPEDMDLDSLRQVLDGRLLFLEEIEQVLLERKIRLQADLETVLQCLFLQGDIDFIPGITWEGEHLRCQRCGQSDNIRQTQCFSCGEYHCYYCEGCLSTGESRLCKPLYGKRAGCRGVQGEAISVRLDFSLSRAQKDTASALKTFVRNDKERYCLVWAVCGAGKTEVSFWAVAEALNNGGKVLYVSPRKGVVTELLPRFKKAFPGIQPALLHGGIREKYTDSPLTFATTHQTIRFYRRFDLVILDEVDAYPYQGAAVLHHAVQRATRETGKTIYLTATPTSDLMRRVNTGEVKLVRIPARYHGYPLPEPEILVEKALHSDNDGQVVLPQAVLELIHLTVEGDLAQLFVFVPSVFLAQRVGETLQQLVGKPPFNDFAGEWVQYSHSKDPLREEKRKRFSRGDFPIFVSTTIMERGITVPRTNVVVLFAEKDRIFDTGTLVQMAGRAGRSAENPFGRVWFVGARTTPSMKTAVEWVKNMNQEAYQLGYLREDLYRSTGERG
ncbi:DEAD/DEAH box helicase family protein [Metallumcola ferriviriculae]|uniref:DEAD/DEAH box helicase family protein n=1 Tax=Metallumcola ferriviriculae TaxID=3039180 RepID=A0AAU0UJF3_9FIRM|nr:DEAD/DEAH box helicase family protein [Desulfitibacteraceae bacterium MK1]